MFAKVNSLGVFALNGFKVTVETDISGGLPQFSVVGLPDNAVKEAADRVRSALKNSKFTFPPSRITVNLAPADIRKSGSVYDLPILISLLVASEELKPINESCAFIGELGLDGSVRSVNGVLSMIITAKECGICDVFVPYDNACEASAIDGINIYAVKTVGEVCRHLKGETKIKPSAAQPLSEETLAPMPDFAEVRGQYEAKRALEIAAAGGHNVVMVGSPGSGKSMLAKRLPSILPPLTKEEAIETTKIYSISGMLEKGASLMTHRPFRSPHHTVSAAGLSGGGSIPKPGEVSLAHNGVLFLDELPEFARDALEILRQPIEDKTITISRVSASATFPCNIMFIAAMNPCPCGYFGHPTKNCSCSIGTVERYLQKISGPLLDRIDIHVEVMPVEYNQLNSTEEAETSAEILKRVIAARNIQHKRYSGTGISCNSQLTSAMLRKYCKMTIGANELLQNAFNKMGLSARAYDRILKVARTIADLDESIMIDKQHIAEAVQYRNLDRKYWSNK